VPAESRNPFRYGKLAAAEHFTDREREQDVLASAMRSGQDVVVAAPRRYGKSSLALRVADELRRGDVLVAYCDLWYAPSKEVLAARLARSIYHDVASLGWRLRDRLGGLGDFVARLTITPTITPDPASGHVVFGFQPGLRAADIDATVEALLALPGEISRDRGRQVALVLDEFQEILRLDRNYPKLLRSVFQAQQDVSHVYLGSRRHLMASLFEDENEPFYRSARQLTLGPIADDWFAPYIEERFASTGRRIAPEATAAILALTGGHPYRTQELCSFAWAETPARGKATARTVEVALDALIDSEHNFYARVWQDASRAQQLVLTALALEPGPLFAEGYRRAHGLGPASTVQRAVGALVRDELVAQDASGAYRVDDPFLERWLRREASEG
jgi:hypothetical protein